MCRFDGFSTACVQVNAFEDGSTVKLQIAAHIGARESVEQNFREPQLHIAALDQKWCRALQHPKRNHCRSAGWIEILFLSHMINNAILLVLIFDPNQTTLCLQQPKRIKWLNLLCPKDMYDSTWTDETRCSLKEVVLDISSGKISICRKLSLWTTYSSMRGMMTTVMESCELHIPEESCLKCGKFLSFSRSSSGYFGCHYRRPL